MNNELSKQFEAIKEAARNRPAFAEYGLACGHGEINGHKVMAQVQVAVSHRGNKDAVRVTWYVDEKRVAFAKLAEKIEA